ncbi:2,3-bisphosphoglycerate-dependent phosphoglycerate mutase-like [Ylistrum balloti]|uniref:2,3-bisphosphoglycerate-dependent phosphoglycerate mutase-like n=1 Tax=Ylistrum balloti TaxID=509963 RepID=UPI002905D7CA|nr:2,3-bisphosphoglycerate-dependent phosphoglycerate mutase-like [Ylistrum balloti]
MASTSDQSPADGQARYTFVILRHGESEYNSEKRVTGWADSDLTSRGVEQARCVGQILKKNGLTFDIAFTSVLKRAIKTLYFVQDELDLHWIQVHKHWCINERHQGANQGQEMNHTKKYKKEASAFDDCPPALEESDERWQRTVNDYRYNMLSPSVLPRAESSKMALERFLHYWHSNIVPEIKAGKKVIIVAHSNIMKNFHKYLGKINNHNDSDLKKIEQGKPLVYELDHELYTIGWKYLE